MLLDTPRLRFRDISISDTEELFRIWSDPKVTEFLVLDPFTTSDEAAGMVRLLEELPVDGAGHRWTVIERATGRVMGTLGFHNVRREHHRAEIGYEIAPEFWGVGLMSEALQRLIEYCFQSEGLNRIEAFVNEGNERSYRVLERNGFVREGILRDYEFARGCFVNQALYSLLKRDWDMLIVQSSSDERNLGD